jgi:hypothetical protein
VYGAWLLFFVSARTNKDIIIIIIIIIIITNCDSSE